MPVKISALPAATSANFTDQLPMSVGTSTTYKEYPAQLQALFLSSIGYTLLTGVRLAETNARTVIYNNGAAGVGATLTNNTTLAALTIDGVAAAVGDRVIIAAQASSFQNGIYSVTNIGSASVAWILTRVTDWDVSAEMIQFQMTTVSEGTLHANQVWQYVTPDTITVGTTGITWQEFATDAVTARKIQNNAYIRSADGGIVNAYVANILPAIATYEDGLRVDLLIGNLNTGASTLKVGTGPVTAVKLLNGDDLAGGELPAGMIAQFEFDRTYFQLLNAFDPFDSGAATRLSVVLPGIQTIPLNTTQDVQFSSVLFDTTGWFNPVTYTWEPDGSGEVNMFIGMAINTSLIDTLATSPRITLLKNGSPIKNGGYAGSSPNSGTLSLGGVIQYAPGDIFKVTVFNSSVSDSISINPGQAGTYWDISSVSNVNVPFVSPLSLTEGGTAKSLIADNGGIIYSDADSFEILAHTTTALQVLQSGNAAAPAWSTATYPATTTVNQVLYSSSANTIGGITTANDGVLITSGAGVPSISSTLPSAVVTNITSLPGLISPKFRAFRSTSQTISTATFTKMQLNNETFDTNGYFDPVTNYRFLPLVAGYYQINGSCGIIFEAGDLTIDFAVEIYKNGVVYSATDVRVSVASASQVINTQDIVFLNGSTDYVELFVYQASGANRDTVPDGASCYMSGSLLV